MVIGHARRRGLEQLAGRPVRARQVAAREAVLSFEQQAGCSLGIPFSVRPQRFVQEPLGAVVPGDCQQVENRLNGLLVLRSQRAQRGGRPVPGGSPRLGMGPGCCWRKEKWSRTGRRVGSRSVRAITISRYGMSRWT